MGFKLSIVAGIKASRSLKVFRMVARRAYTKVEFFPIKIPEYAPQSANIGHTSLDVTISKSQKCRQHGIIMVQRVASPKFEMVPTFKVAKTNRTVSEN